MSEKDARANLRLGYCPCGDEYDHDCECFGTYRLSVAQGLIEPTVIRVPARASSGSEER